MAVDIFYSLSNLISTNHILKSLKHRDKSAKHIVIVPDRCALNIEKKLFTILEEKCFFDIDVTTLSRLSQSVIKNSAVKQKILNKQSGIAIIKKIAMEEKENLKCFSSVCELEGFAESIFEIICLFKSCNIGVNEIDVSVEKINLNSKLTDIKYLYSKYEEFLKNDYTDSFNELTLFENLINKETFNNTIFYFVEFDSFTNQMYQIFQKLLKCNYKLNFGCVSNYRQKVSNNHIFTNEIFYTLIDMCKTNGFEYDLFLANSMQNQFYDLNRHLLGVNAEKFENDANLQILKFDNIFEELEFVFSEIKFNIIEKNLRFKDFTIIVPNLTEISDKIKEVAQHYSVNAFLDESETLEKSVIWKYFNNVFDILLDGLNEQNFICFLKNYKIDKKIVFKFDNYLKKYHLQNKTIYKSHEYTNDFQEIDELFNLILKKREQFTNAKNINAINRLFDDLLKNLKFENFLNDHIQDLTQNFDILQVKKVEQAKEKFVKIFKDISDVFGVFNLDLKTYYEIFKIYVLNTSLTLAPISLDSVFVGDLLKSYFSENKFVYILNANENAFPSIQRDIGLLCDNELKLLKNYKKINPTIEQINKRNKLKSLNSFGFAERQLKVCFANVNFSGELIYKSQFVNSLQKLTCVDIIEASNIFKMDFYNRIKIDKDNILFNNFNIKSANINFVNLIKKLDANKNNSNYIKLLSVLKNCLNKDFICDVFNKLYFKNDIKNFKYKFCKNDMISVSQIETFYGCPFKHFILYGLKLNENDTGKLTQKDVGNIIHDVLKIIVPEIIKENEFKKVEHKITSIMQTVLKNDKYEHIRHNKCNTFDLFALNYEICGIVDFLINNFKNSNFVPAFYEYEFIFNLPKNNFKLHGFIDRIDFYSNGFIITDYKTGNVQFNDYTEIFAGKKLQLFTYASVYEQISEKNCFGSLYLPLANKYEIEKKKRFSYTGVLFRDVLTEFDTNLIRPSTNSEFVDLKTGANGEIYENAFYKKFCLSLNEMDILKKSSLNLITTALKEIKAGVIEPLPFKFKKIECSFCKYGGICNFNYLYKNKSNNFEKIENITALNQKGGQHE